MSQVDPLQGVRAFRDPATLLNERSGHKMRRLGGGHYTLSFYDRRWHWVDEFFDALDVADAAEHIITQGYKVRVEWSTPELEESVTIAAYDLDALNLELRGEP